uniref:Uncharacterized protein n=1 Tax=Rhizophora mucronata TaxID=61149 RepID=A0A2P2P3I2_RHIMU
MKSTRKIEEIAQTSHNPLVQIRSNSSQFMACKPRATDAK